MPELGAVCEQTTRRSRCTRRLVRHRMRDWTMLILKAAVPGSPRGELGAQDAPKLLRQACASGVVAWRERNHCDLAQCRRISGADGVVCVLGQSAQRIRGSPAGRIQDRKSTRLNSSHTVISYAVFCLQTKI